MTWLSRSSKLALVLLAACGGKVEKTGTLHSDVAVARPGPPDAGPGVGSGTASDAAALSGDFQHIAADATDFYLAGKAGTIVRVPKTGGEAVVVTADDDYIEGIAVDATHVYWTRLVGNEIVRAPKAGGASEVLARDQIRPWGLAVDDERVYWACEGDAVAGVVGTPPGGRIASVAKDGGKVDVIAPDQQTPTAVLLDGDFVYFGENGWGDANGTVKRVPKKGGAIETLATRVDGVRSLAVARGHVAWVSFTSLNQVALTGGPVLAVTPVPNTAAVGGGLATDGTSFLFGYSGTAGGEILAVDAGTTTTRTIAKPSVPSDATHFIAEDAIWDGGAVHWLDGWWSYADPTMRTAIRAAQP